MVKYPWRLEADFVMVLVTLRKQIREGRKEQALEFIQEELAEIKEKKGVRLIH